MYIKSSHIFSKNTISVILQCFVFSENVNKFIFFYITCLLSIALKTLFGLFYLYVAKEINMCQNILLFKWE